ncbi:MAG: hypothetical protein WA417_15140, partial [Stellaceae bacterium]
MAAWFPAAYDIGFRWAVTQSTLLRKDFFAKKLSSSERMTTTAYFQLNFISEYDDPKRILYDQTVGRHSRESGNPG